MAGFLDSAEIEIPCKACGGKTKKSIGWIKGNKEFTCACGIKVTLDASQFKSEISKVEGSLADLKSALKQFDK